MNAKLEKIIIKINNSEVEKIEAIIHKMALIPSLETTPLSYGKIGEEVIASFDIDEAHYAMMVEKLFSSGLNVLPTNDKVTQILEFLQGRQVGKAAAKQENPLGSGNQAPIQANSVEEFKKNGKYEELIRISKTLNVDPALKSDAKKALLDAVKKAIDNNYNYAFVNKYAVVQSVNNLIKIASDLNLKTLNMQALQKLAGENAINICANYLEQVDELIKICNDHHLSPSINVKAAVKFWELVTKDTTKFAMDINVAAKTLNVRFLENVFDVVKYEFDDSEKKYFTQFTEFVRSKRNI